MDKWLLITISQEPGSKQIYLLLPALFLKLITFPCSNIVSSRGGNWDLHSEQVAKQKCYCQERWDWQRHSQWRLKGKVASGWPLTNKQNFGKWGVNLPFGDTILTKPVLIVGFIYAGNNWSPEPYHLEDGETIHLCNFRILWKCDTMTCSWGKEFWMLTIHVVTKLKTHTAWEIKAIPFKNKKSV